MKNRSYNLIQMRPHIEKIKSFENMSRQEVFQNKTLRPILKLQNQLLLEIFRDYIITRKGTFYNLNNLNRLDYIEKNITKDQKFQNSIKGIIIGHFTIDEYQIYNQDISSINKRIINLAIDRLKDQVEYFINRLTIHN
tara:strand:+ start:1738 stop:2151 length:414 start_codon:yes stop_codon:yes gene_type:complete